MDNNELIGDGGNKLSGGEKLRVAFLRAILKNFKILILDETTSSLDTDNKDIIIETLKRLKEDGWTIIFCTHSTNDKLDRKSTRLNSSHARISYAVFCLKKKK